MLLTVILIWLGCGFLNYGIDKGGRRDRLLWSGATIHTYGSSGRDEIRHWILALMGPIWSVATLIGLLLFCRGRKSWKFWEHISFCLLLPDSVQ